VLRRILVLVVQLYLTADYCDPSVPGVFFFETDSYFVDSVEAKPAMRVLTSPSMCAMLPARQLLEPPTTPRATTAARPSARLGPYSPRSYIVASPPTAPESSEDH
jgi:hypothetical protein